MKGIKWILGVMAAAGLFASANAIAQEKPNRDQFGEVVRGPYNTNKAFDNTFIGVGAGINAVVATPTVPANWGNVGMSTALNFGKWWTPAVGSRLGWHGLWNNSKLDLDLSEIAADTPFGFNYFHTDLLWNLSTTVAGYNPERLWDFVPYLSIGALDISKKRNIFIKDACNQWEYAAGVGLLNLIKLHERCHVTLDLQMLVGKAKNYSTSAGRFILFPSATLGLAFNLGKTDFERSHELAPVPIPVPFTEESYNALGDRLAVLEKENAQLKERAAALENQLAPFRKLVNGTTYLYENGTFTAVDVQPGSPVAVYFDMGSAQLSAREQAHLEYFAAHAVNADTKLMINGYADKQTGSAQRNQKLSEQRVKAVADFLKKAGATEMECNAHGAEIQPFEGAEKNRVVTIELK